LTEGENVEIRLSFCSEGKEYDYEDQSGGMEQREKSRMLRKNISSRGGKRTKVVTEGNKERMDNVFIIGGN